MNSVEKETVLHCLKSMIDEEVCEECPLYGMTGTDHCEKDCVRLAINALEQEPCTDAISRQAAIDGADAIIARDTSGNNDVVKAMTAWKSYVEGLPPVTPAEKVGQWIDIQYFKADDTYYRPKCPFCNTEPKEYSNYCPNCGAWMSASPTGAERSDKE